MTTDRKPRELETRALDERLTPWQPPELLPNPNPRPGWIHRWVRVGTFGEADMSNFSVRRREGWEPCAASEYTELDHLTRDVGRERANEIVVGGLMLCRMPEAKVLQRRRYYEQMAGAQMQAVDNSYFREQDKRMPLFADRESRSSLEFGKGSK